MARKRTIPRTRNEASLVKSAYNRLKENPSLHVHFNVPLLGRYADLAYMADESIITVEFKIRDWRRATKQARDHLLAADFAYVCMPARRLSEEFARILTDTGVGLLFFKTRGEWPFEIIVEAQKSTEKWSIASSAVRQFLLNHK